MTNVRSRDTLAIDNNVMVFYVKVMKRELAEEETVDGLLTNFYLFHLLKYRKGMNDCFL